jgi:RNA polymerase sigma-70 factor (ECF subfamily)
LGMDIELSEERKIIKKAKQDPQVFGLLYDKYYQPIFGYVLRRTADVELAQDVTSQTFFKALKKLWQFRWQGVPFSSWLYRIASNEIANHFRKNNHYSVSLEKLAQKGFELSALSNPEQELIEAQKELQKHQEFLKIQEKIILLSPKYQEVIALRFFEKKKIKEIAQILDKKEGTVKSLLHRGLNRLRVLM